MALAAVLGLYFVFLAIGVAAARRTKGGSSSDLIVAGRAMPLWLAILTMTATWVDGGYLLGTVEGTFRSGLASGIQGGLCFGISLVLGGLLFARRMRALEFTTLVDPFESRFGTRWAAVLMIPALLGELFWSAELLVAIGSTFGVMLGMGLAAAVLLSAVVVIAYTMLGGMWSVAYTDAFQLGLVALGLLAALPFAFHAAGGLEVVWASFVAARPDGATLLPPFAAQGSWSVPAIVNWWDVSVMLVLGGIPWNCYFQRVLSCRSPEAARRHSILAGLLTIAFTAPPLLLGIAAVAYRWPSELLAQLQGQPARALPMILQHVVPGWVALLGLAAIIGAVTSSFSASVLSAASMFAWNCCYRAWRPALSRRQLAGVVRLAVLGMGAGATVLALEVQSVQALWFFTSDLVFVLLVPQLFAALFDPRANRAGSVAAFAVSLVLRLGGGEPLFGLPPLLPYPEVFAPLLGSPAASWYDPASGALLFPFKTVAAAAGLIVLPLVSRLTSGWDPPRVLCNLPRAEARAAGGEAEAGG